MKITATDVGMSYSDMGAGVVNLDAAIPPMDFSINPYNLRVTSDPTTRYTEEVLSFTITSREETFTDIIFVPRNIPGVTTSIIQAPNSISPSGSGSVELEVTIDNDNIASFGSQLLFVDVMQNGELLSSLPLTIDVLPTWKLDVLSLDFGVNSPDELVWESPVRTVTITNHRKDIAVTLHPEISGFASGIGLEASPITILPEESKNVQLQLTADNTNLENSIYTGFISIESGELVLDIPARFTKYYVLRMVDSSESHKTSIQVYNPVADAQYSVFPPTDSQELFVPAINQHYDIFIDFADTLSYADGNWKRVDRKLIIEDVYLDSAETIVEYSIDDAVNKVQLKYNTPHGQVIDPTIIVSALRGEGLTYTATILDWGQTDYTEMYMNDFSADVDFHYGMHSYETVGKVRKTVLNSLAITNGLFNDYIVNVQPQDFRKRTYTYELQTEPVVTNVYLEANGAAFTLSSEPREAPFTEEYYSNADPESIFTTAYEFDTNEQACESLPCYTQTRTGSIEAGTEEFASYWNNPTSLEVPENTIIGLGPAWWAGTFRVSEQDASTQYYVFQDYYDRGGIVRYQGHQYKPRGAMNYITTPIEPSGQQMLSPLSSQKGYPGHITLLSQSRPKGLFEVTSDFTYYTSKGLAQNAYVRMRYDSRNTVMSPPRIVTMEFQSDQQASEYYLTESQNTWSFTLDPIDGTLDSIQAFYSLDDENYVPLSLSRSGNTANLILPLFSVSDELWLRLYGEDSAGNFIEYSFSMPVSGANFVEVPLIVNGLGSIETGSVSCSADCISSFLDGEIIYLTAVAQEGHEFVGWSGSCSGNDTCMVQIEPGIVIEANFQEISYVYHNLNVTANGPGNVLVNGEACQDNCIFEILDGELATLSVSYTNTVNFNGWSGACTGINSCSIIMSEDKSVTADFANANETVTLTVQREGQGTVTAGGYVCNEDFCQFEVTIGTSFPLEANAASGWSFAGFDPACQSSRSCIIHMTEDKEVTATFLSENVQDVTLSVQVNGPGKVTNGVTTCSDACDYILPPGTALAATALADEGANFVSWEGLCSGQGSCSFTVNEDALLVVNFEETVVETVTLSIALEGEGSVVGPGFVCMQTTCQQEIPLGQTIELQAEGQGTTSFAQWSGACSGFSSSCVLQMNQDRSLTAVFENVDEPSNLNAQRDSLTSILLSWEGPDATYTVQRDIGNWQTIAITTEKEFLDMNLETNTFYEYRVRAGTGAASSEWMYAQGQTCYVNPRSGYEVC